MMPFVPNSRAMDLGVNIDHVATVRNARGTFYPDPIEAALLAEEAGADLITLHLREDRRHIRDADVRRLLPLLRTRMNLEMAVTEEMLRLACELRPADVCLVPEKRAEVTTEGGLDVRGNFAAVSAACARLADAGVRVSLFIDPDVGQVAAAVAAAAPVIEIHTGRYAEAAAAAELAQASGASGVIGEGGVAGAPAGTTAGAAPLSAAAATELERVRAAARAGCAAGLRVNAGHGLNIANVTPVAALAEIGELNIGHAIVARALFIGWQAAVREIKALMVAARP